MTFVTDSRAQLQTLRKDIANAMLADRHRLRRRLQGVERAMKEGKDTAHALEKLCRDIAASAARVANRHAALPQPTYPEELPVVQKREEIAKAIAENQVVVVCGETGSGKTTQLPKICLELGRGVSGLIGHTQPRRIAARSVAKRIAEELQSDMGHAVGFKVRFSDHVGEGTYVKLMTDGILLAETQGDRFLEQYDTLIIDEAHERSLNIDFLLGYLKQLLPRRPDLKVIVTSATIDPQRFSRHFNDAPVVEVSGRTYPVEVHYRPLVSDDEDEQDRDLQQAILAGVDEVSRQGPGDILIFMSGEREIRETAESLRKHHPPHTEIVPLYARLSAAEQERVFKSHSGRRIVLATNVAETSLTVPGIRYVIDPGQARISRYSYRTKVQRLPVEKVSQASANQRKGRCGRVAAGVCVRLYSEEDFLARLEFTDPEIQRTNLASVILQMQALKLGDVDDFPFVDRPDPRYINDGFKLLHELGAMDEGRRLTEIGRQLARLPVDPRIGRMVLAGQQENALSEVLIIAAALSIQDPRERPMETRQAADEKHRRFWDERSDFLAYLNLWQYFEEQTHHLSQNKLRKLCKQEFLSYVRMREWREVHSQLKTLVTEMGLRPNQQPAEYAEIHRALLAGLLGNVAFKSDNHEYTGARNTKVQIFPGSGLFKKGPKWLIAAEIMETGRVYAHTVARIEPEWIERLAGHLVKRSYFDPHWEKRPAQVAASEQVSLYGLVINPRRRINYGPVNPKEAREIFIRAALVQGDYHSDAPFFSHNRGLIDEVEELEAKSRRRDILVDEETLYRFYDERVPEGIYSGAGFEKWRRHAEQRDPKALFLSRDYLMRRGAAGITVAQFPEQITVEGIPLPLEYHFEPGHPMDGVTVTVPLAVLNQLSPQPFEWLVPGLLREKITELIRSLPKVWRRNFVPAPNYADACVAALAAGEGSLLEAVARQLQRMTGVEVPTDAWQLENVAPHLFMNFKLVDDQGKTLASGRNLARLQREQGERAQATFKALPSDDFEREGITAWDFGELPAFVEIKRHGMTLRGYPALVDEKNSVALRRFDAPEKATVAMGAGLRRLFMLQLSQQMKYLRNNLPGVQQMCLHYATVGNCEALKQELVDAIVERTFIADKPPINDAAAFYARKDQGRGELMNVANEFCKLVADILAELHAVNKRLKGSISPAWLSAMGDIKEQLARLLHKGFIADTPYAWLQHVPRYVKAIQVRLDKLDKSPARDRQQAMEIAPLWQAYVQRHERNAKRGLHDPELEAYRWMLEELRVSLFAQELKTSIPVSPQRLRKQWQLVAA